MAMFELYPSFLAFVILFCVTVFLYRCLFIKEPLKIYPPSPPKFPIIGNFHQLGRDKHISLRALAQKYGPLMLIHLGSTPVLVVSSAAAATEILKIHDLVFSDKPRSSISSRIFYNGKDVVFAPYGEYWRQVKSMCVLQLLSSKRIRSFRNVRDEEVALLIQRIKESPSKVVNLRDLFATLANNIVCRIALGKKYEGGKGVAFKKLLGEMSELLSYAGLGAHIPWLYWVYNFKGLKGSVEKVANKLDHFLEEVVTDHIIASENIGAANQDFVSILLENWKQKTGDGFSVDKDCIKALALVSNMPLPLIFVSSLKFDSLHAVTYILKCWISLLSVLHRFVSCIRFGSLILTLLIHTLYCRICLLPELIRPQQL